MKKLITLIAILALLIPATNSYAQIISESAKKKFSVGADVFTDIWLVENDEQFLPSGYSNRTINQGATAFFNYNAQIGQGLSAFSIGIAIRNHNSYSNSVIIDIKATEIVFHEIEKIPTPDRTINLDYQRSKINMTFVDLPLEYKFRTEGGFKLGIGFRVGYLIDSKQKYVGEWPVSFSFNDPDGEVKYNKVKDKSKGINQLQKWSYGANFRIGYKFISLYAFYQFNKVFESGRGPDMQPISLGITITPF